MAIFSYPSGQEGFAPSPEISVAVVFGFPFCSLIYEGGFLKSYDTP